MNVESQVRKHRRVERDQLAVAIDADQISRVVWVVIDVIFRDEIPQLVQIARMPDVPESACDCFVGFRHMFPRTDRIPKECAVGILGPNIPENHRFGRPKRRQGAGHTHERVAERHDRASTADGQPHQTEPDPE